jgi:hypothetical protein
MAFSTNASIYMLHGTFPTSTISSYEKAMPFISSTYEALAILIPKYVLVEMIFIKSSFFVCLAVIFGVATPLGSLEK